MTLFDNLKEKRRSQWSWYLYDFGNSAYAAVVLLAIYAAYFKQGVVAGPEGSALWGLSLTIAMLGGMRIDVVTAVAVALPRFLTRTLMRTIWPLATRCRRASTVADSAGAVVAA